MKKATTEFRAPEDESQQSSLKRVRTDSTEMIDKNSDGRCLEPADSFLGLSCSFFQTPKQDYSSDAQGLDVNMFDPDLFAELDFFETDLLAELPIDLTHGCSDQTMSVNPSSQNAEFNWDEISGAFDLELDSSLFEIDETTFKL